MSSPEAIALSPTLRRLAEGFRPVAVQPPCLGALVLSAGKNPMLPIQASDARGAFHALSFAAEQPLLVEVVHSVPGALRGNHKHLRAVESFHVLSGEVELCLCCTCAQRHVNALRMRAGDGVIIPAGVAHAMLSISQSEILAAFTGADPRHDRMLITMVTPEAQ